MKRPSLGRRLTTLWLVGSLVPGCSFIFSEGPPAGHRQMPYFSCSQSYAPPILDTVGAGFNAINLITALSSENRSAGDVSREFSVGLGLVGLGISGASAIYGYRKVGQCKQAKDELLLRYRAPQSYPGYPPPGSYPPPAPPPS